MTRIQSSIPRTKKALGQIATVRKAYRDAVTEHRVLVVATEIGLSVLAADPELLSTNDNNEEK